MIRHHPNQDPRARRASRTAAGAALAALLALAGPAAAVDLLDVFRLALTSDPGFQAALAANRASQELRPQAFAAIRPDARLSYSIDSTREDVKRAGFFGGGRVTQFTTKRWALDITQPLYRKDLFVAVDQADTRISQADAELAFARQDLMLRVAERYFGVLRARDDLEFQRAEKDAFSQQLEQARQRFDVGLIAITDVEEAKAGFDLAVAAEIAAVNALDNAGEALREIIGEYQAAALAPLGERLPLITPAPPDIDRWTRTSLRQNWQVTAARYSAQTARKEIRRRAAGHLPTLDLVGSAQVQEQGGGIAGGSETEDVSLGLRLSVPIYQGGSVLSRTREAQHLYRQSLDELKATQRAAQRQTRDAFLGVQSGISRVRALSQALASTQSALEAVEAGFQVGTRTSVDVLNAQRDVFRAKRDYAGARYDYLLDILRLKQAAGTLGEEDLQQINAWLL